MEGSSGSEIELKDHHKAIRPDLPTPDGKVARLADLSPAATALPGPASTMCWACRSAPSPCRAREEQGFPAPA